MPKKNIIISLFLLLIITNIIPQDNQIDTMNNTMIDSYYSGIIVKIELANPKIYYQNDDIYINVKIFNTTNEEKSLLIANDKRYSFDFEIVTMQNRAIEHSNEYIISFHKVQPVFNSIIRVAPNEGYVYEARLKDYFDLNKAGQYFIKCLYHPELKLNNSKERVINSNLLSVNIRPGEISTQNIVEEKSIEEEKMYFATKRSPDEVVSYMLNARINQEWEKFYLYLDLEKLILTNNNFRAKYVKADAERQHELIKQYKEYLKRNTIDEISFLPNKFEIMKTEYTEGRGKVEVVIYFKYLDYTEKKYYTYFLNKKGNIWYIYSYEVMNMGTM